MTAVVATSMPLSARGGTKSAVPVVSRRTAGDYQTGPRDPALGAPVCPSPTALVRGGAAGAAVAGGSIRPRARKPCRSTPSPSSGPVGPGQRGYGSAEPGGHGCERCHSSPMSQVRSDGCLLRPPGRAFARTRERHVPRLVRPTARGPGEDREDFLARMALEWLSAA